jgi:MFS superfamily sulfate permease-like transporter
MVYAFFGKTRRLAVLPEAALSLVVGEAIRQNVEKNNDHGTHIRQASEMCCLITFLAAAITLLAGMFRLGFVDIIGSPVLDLSLVLTIAIAQGIYFWRCTCYFC